MVTKWDATARARYERKVRSMPIQVKRRLEGALRKSGDELVAQMQRFVGVGDGDLYFTIEWDWTKGSPGSQLEFKGSQRLAITVSAGTTNEEGVFYASFVEFGHSNGVNGSVVPPNPFFYPAYRVLRTRIRGRTTREVNKGIKESAGLG